MLFLFIISCSVNEELDFNETANENNSEKHLRNLKNDERPNIIVSDTELIIQFNENISDAEKNNIRSENNISEYEVCNCTDGSIEKWSFGSIEDKKILYNASESGGIEEIKNVDLESSFHKESQDPPFVINSSFMNYQDVISQNQYGVTIAVLDTGIDVNYPGFIGLYLYDASGTMNGNNTNLPNQISGWDYVNEQDDTHDDHSGIHGTKVSYIIHEKLINDDIPHRLLPIKVADNHGKISAFNLICGTKNAVEFADIINMSLGYYSNAKDVRSIIMEDIISNNPEILFVTSAGNQDEDNDNNTHYPSCYSQGNVVAIAAANEDGDGKASFSNYGVESVDFYALGENIPFLDYNTETENFISGTSFAAPYVSAIAAGLLFNSGMTLDPKEIIQKLDSKGILIPQDQELIKYGKIIE